MPEEEAQISVQDAPAQRARIADVAREAGVSKAAVSFAFNNPERLAVETAERIRRVADDLGYRPHPVARMLTAGSTATIGILSPQALAQVFANPFFPLFAEGVAPIPEMEETPAPFIGVQGMMVSAFAPNKLLATEFLREFMATDEAMQSLFDADPRPPAWTAVAEGVEDENVQAFITSAANGNPMPAIPEMSSVWGAWTDALDLIFNQNGDPEEIIRTAAENVRQAIEAGQ